MRLPPARCCSLRRPLWFAACLLAQACGQLPGVNSQSSLEGLLAHERERALQLARGSSRRPAPFDSGPAGEAQAVQAVALQDDTEPERANGVQGSGCGRGGTCDAGPSAEAPAWGSGCGRDFVRDLKDYISVSGWPLSEWSSDFPQASHSRGCSDLFGTLAKVQFDVLRYAARGLSDPSRTPSAEFAYLRMAHHYQAEFTDEELAQYQLGLALCLPGSCRSGSGDELVSVALLSFLFLAGQSVDGVESVRRPLVGDEINVTVLSFFGWSFPPGARGAPGAERSLAWPWWTGCGRAAEEWARWAKTVRSMRRPGPDDEPDPGVVREADRLLTAHRRLALEWPAWAREYTRLSRYREHEHFEDWTAYPTYWAVIEDWKAETGFCPHGYIVALLLRGFATWRAGLSHSAGEDLGLARSMLGACVESEPQASRCCAAALWPPPGPEEVLAASIPHANASADGASNELPDCRATDAGQHHCGEPLLTYAASLIWETPPDRPAWGT
mmetsp:Transcript_44721/g.133603  ORF Transcript_44721/g.133603 Transcript_44721/m.133603 type:complete len:500 (+) Transcript_44721:74-1573(+)